MKAIDYFTELEEMREDIEYAKELKQEYLDKAISITSQTNTDRVQTSRDYDGRVGKYSTMAADLERNIEHDELKYFEHESEIIKQIRDLHNKYFIQILFKVYVQHKSLKQASKEMKKSYNHTIELHDKALVEFERVNADAMEKWEQKRKVDKKHE